ncbi:benzoate 4-monooxygenase cytochrome P450 [Penicillium brasilianum]|uniref:Benzoate 4-monooxygenase cytochrome P450 n=1 Tax=Penicillium brasilianum TaxID=104259 RepID=A0A1S9R877_PENBI|nr:benzoate 4-monooxygenase cytochrome P450 [Penicillium brasilianum]
MIFESFCCILSGFALYNGLIIFYNLYFHPLSKFPGPKLAACSHLYEFYFDIIKNGMFMQEIARMHEVYGPIVRITPREIHIKDAEFYDEIYCAGNRKREKDPQFVSGFVSPHSVITTIDHDLHKRRKNMMKNFFSKGSITELEFYIRQKTEKFADRFDEAYQNGGIILMESIFSGLTADVITLYAFGTSYDYLENRERANNLQSAGEIVARGFHFNRFFPFIRKAVLFMPNLATTLLPESEAIVKTLFDGLTTPSIPSEEKTMSRLMDEGLVLLLAGTATTTRVLVLATFHLYNDVRMLAKLRAELKDVMPTPSYRPSWAELEHLPYLTATINEGLRLTFGVTFRQPRVAPHETLLYGKYAIPPGTPVSESTYLLHTDPVVFPEPHTFRPERWTEASSEQKEQMRKHFAPFSKGSRQCIGMNLAYCEMYLALAHVVRRYDMELYDTTFNNVHLVRDLGLGFPKEKPLSVKTRVTGVLTE